MKIALFYNLTPGGADRALFEVAKRLLKKHSVDIYTMRKTSSEKKLLLDNLPVKYFRFKINLPQNFFHYLFFIYFKLINVHKRIANLINKRNYDVVLVAEDYLTKSPYILRFLKKPCLFFCQSHFREFYDPKHLFSHLVKYKLINILRYPLKLIDIENINSTDIVVGNSSYLKSRLEKIYQRKIKKISYGVRQTNITSFNKQEDYFLSVGSLTIFKGMAFIIKAVSLLPKNKKLPLVIVANGGRDEKYIINLAQKLKVDLKIIRGINRGLNDKKLVRLYNKAKLFLFAPYNEPFGLVVLEAMACGLPVVGVDEGGLKESIINGVNGWRVKRDEKEFSQKIQTALKKTNKNFRQQTKNSIKKWSWNKSALMMEKLLIKASKKRK